MNLQKKIKQVIVLAKEALRGEDAYPFLPEIIESLEVMQKSLKKSQSRRTGIAGSLDRLVTEDFIFSESKLGQKLLQVADEFASLSKER